MYSTSPNVIETDDIAEVRQLGEARTLPDGRTALPVLLILGTDSDGNGKSHGPGNFPHTFHVTNGVFPRNLPILLASVLEFGIPSEPDQDQKATSPDDSDGTPADDAKDEPKTKGKKKSAAAEAGATDTPPSGTAQ